MSGDLATRVQSKAAARKDGSSKTLDEWLVSYSDDFAAALPAYVDQDRFMRLVLNTLRYNQELRECDKFSLIGAMMECAQLGLEPSGPLNHVYMSPRNQKVGKDASGKDIWIRRVELTIGYQGYIELATRTGAVKSIRADLVYENDEYESWTDNGVQQMRHKPLSFGDRGEVMGAYAVAVMVDGSCRLEEVTLETIEKAKKSSPAGRKNQGPWVDWWEEMARKTAVRRLWKWLPKTEESVAGYQMDGAVVATVDRTPLAERAPMPVLDVVTDEGQDDGQTVDAEEAETQEAPADPADGPEDTEPDDEPVEDEPMVIPGDET